MAGLTQRGISTSAFGLGRSFDEDLMGAIATAGDGTLAQIESPQQLADLYASELSGLASTVGSKVSLGIRAQQGAELVDVLNDLPPTTAGNLQLPNLRWGASRCAPACVCGRAAMATPEPRTPVVAIDS